MTEIDADLENLKADEQTTEEKKKEAEEYYRLALDSSNNKWRNDKKEVIKLKYNFII